MLLLMVRIWNQPLQHLLKMVSQQLLLLLIEKRQQFLGILQCKISVNHLQLFLMTWFFRHRTSKSQSLVVLALSPVHLQRKKQMSSPYFFVPVNRGVALNAGLPMRSLDEMSRFVTHDWAKINPLRAGWIDRFNREMAK